MASVPEAKNGQNAASARLIGKIEARIEIGVEVCGASLLEAMKRDADLVDSCRDELIASPRDERAVGCDRRLEAARGGDTDHLGQFAVQKRLAHQVIVDILGDAHKIIENRPKLGDRHTARRAARAVAEGAIHITAIGNLNVNSGKHNRSSFFYYILS